MFIIRLVKEDGRRETLREEEVLGGLDCRIFGGWAC